MPGNVLRKRIARKILLGYVVPLAVLLVAGLLVPVLFWSYLGQAQAEYDASLYAAERVYAIRRAAQETENALRGYVLYRDQNFRQQFQDANEDFRDNNRDLSGFLESRPDNPLKPDLEAAGTIYRVWRRRSGIPLVRASETGPPPTAEVATVRAERVGRSFLPVTGAMNRLVESMEALRADLREKASANNTLRLLIAVSVPTVAVLLALLIARLNTLGITRPLEALTRAAETLEQGEMARVLLEQSDEIGDDEIGDLQQAFRRMARTIGQREAVLRAQNEALGALNRRVEAVLNSTNDAIVMLDRGGGFSVVNQRFAQLFGIEPEVLLDHTFSQAGPLLVSRFEDKEAVRACFQTVLGDPDATCDEMLEILEPFHRTLRFYSAPVRGGDGASDLLGRIFVFRDVTRETAVDRMKTEFVSTVSHELRTPLTAIKGYIDLMVSGQTGALSEIQQEFLTLVQGSTRRLSALINDMLDVSRIESGRIALRQESVDYLPLVQQTVRMMQNEADARQITLSVQVLEGGGEPSLPPVNGDSDRITQVLVNLLSNAIKYTLPGGAVKVSVEYEGDFITTCVSDTGIGITPEDQTKLFQKFFRADNSTTREAGGTGLGLAITRAILEKLNGSVWVDSDPGQGSRFYFTLPTVNIRLPKDTLTLLEAESAPAPSVAQRSDTAASYAALPIRKLILSVDSDLAALRRIGHALRQGNFATSSAATATEAMRRARALRPDLITLDPMTPHFDGLALLGELQTDVVTRHLPIALLSLRLLGPYEARIRDTVLLLSSPLRPGQLLEILVQATAESDSPAPAILTVGSGPFVDELNRCRFLLNGAASATRLLHFLSAAGAIPHLNDPALALIVLEAEAFGRGAESLGHFVSQILRHESAGHALVVAVTDVPLDPARIVSLTPIRGGSVPLSEMGHRIEVLLAEQEQQRAESLLPV
ncbi:MAG: HAMP domain-containing protein [Cytophagales bacterium]|nr:HAMP domain-containing protein [Armatimonadota bacterium]